MNPLLKLQGRRHLSALSFFIISQRDDKSQGTLKAEGSDLHWQFSVVYYNYLLTLQTYMVSYLHYKYNVPVKLLNIHM